MRPTFYLFSVLKRLFIAISCFCALNATVACEDFKQNLKYEYKYTVKKHNIKDSNIEVIEQALNRHNWKKLQNLTENEAKIEWESFLSDINDEDVKIINGGYVSVSFHKVESMTIDDIITYIDGEKVGEKTWE